MLRAVDKWLVGYLRSVWRRPGRVDGLKHLVFCVADHFEPFANGASATEALERVRRWVEEYPRAVGAYRDADGRPPRHTFFFPADEYDDACVGLLADFCRAGFGEIEIQLHHRHDTAEGLSRKLETFRDYLHNRHGMLGCDATGAVRYGFVHGNWALCNSRPDGDWCGVDAELGVLANTGCYADFTFPSAPSPTQPQMVNAIYYASDCPGIPRGHDRGMLASSAASGKWQAASGQAESVGVGACRSGGEGVVRIISGHGNVTSGRCRPASSIQYPVSASVPALLLIQGPLAPDWRRRKWGVLPRLENAEISGVNPPSSGRVDLWVRQHVHVGGRPDWVFVKVHTHGGVERNRTVLLGEGIRRMHEHLQRRYNDGVEWSLHYATAREMFNMAKAAECGTSGNPRDQRDWLVGAPEN
jgi:hypothetical protein